MSTPAAATAIDANAHYGLYAVVLAAGTASRFGRPKQLAEFRNQSLVTHAVRTAESLCAARSLLVVGSNWQDVHAACAPLLGFLVRNEHFETGMAGSIAAAVRALPANAAGLMLMLADQALIGTDEIVKLTTTWSGKPEHVVCSEFDGVLGPPVIFPRALFAELAALQGERGARSVIARHADRVIAVPCAAAAVDIDTPEDLRRLAAQDSAATDA